MTLFEATNGSDLGIFTYKHILYPLFVMVAFEVLTESFSIRHLVAHLKEEFLPTCSQTLPSWRHNFLFHDIPMQNIYPLDCITDQNCEGGWRFLFMSYVEHGAIAKMLPTRLHTTKFPDEVWMPLPLLSWDGSQNIRFSNQLLQFYNTTID